MSVWFRVALLVVAGFLTAGVARADCNYLGSEGVAMFRSGRTVTTITVFYYDCGGDRYTVTVTTTAYDVDDDGQTYESAGWQQTVTGPSGTITTWGTGRDPLHSGDGVYMFDPRRWAAELPPEY